MRSQNRVLLDSTFLLPTLGVKVTQISETDLRDLAKIRSKVTFYCLHQSLVEILGKVTRSWTDEKGTAQAVEEGLRSLLESGVYTWVNPSVRALTVAIQMKRKGHSDMIDNMLYATATDLGMFFLTLDKELADFLAGNQYSTESIVDVKKLRSLT
jgi:predicted nucleic acid-binding protein